MNILIGIITGIVLLASIAAGILYAVSRIGTEVDANDQDTLKEIEQWRSGE